MSSSPASSQNHQGQRLKFFFQRLENLEDEKKRISDDIREVFQEAKGEGFDPVIMRRVMRMRRMRKDQLAEQEQLTELYLNALESAESGSSD